MKELDAQGRVALIIGQQVIAREAMLDRISHLEEQSANQIEELSKFRAKNKEQPEKVIIDENDV